MESNRFHLGWKTVGEGKGIDKGGKNEREKKLGFVGESGLGGEHWDAKDALRYQITFLRLFLSPLFVVERARWELRGSERTK